jgi:hypothetical protein
MIKDKIENSILTLTHCPLKIFIVKALQTFQKMYVIIDYNIIMHLSVNKKGREII